MVHCFSRPYLPFQCFLAMDQDVLDDSSDDLFITQSTFRSNVDTQEADEAAEFLSTSFMADENYCLAKNYDPAAPERVHYWDFLSSSLNDTDKPTGNAPVLTDGDVDQVSDSVVEAAVKAVLDDTKGKGNSSRHSDPVSDVAVKENTSKGYVFHKF